MDDAERQNEFWDSESAGADFTHPFNLDEFSLHVGKDDSILDFGCGYGRTLKQLLEAGFTSLAGLERSEGMIERARRELPGIGIYPSHSLEIPYRDSSLGAVILLSVLTCLPRNEDHEALLREVSRTVKRGGIVYMGDYLINTDPRSVEGYRKFEGRHGTYGIFEAPEGVAFRHYTEGRVREMTSAFERVFYKTLKIPAPSGNSIFARGKTRNVYQYIGRII